VSAYFDVDISSQYPIPLVNTHQDIQFDSILVDITTGTDFLNLYDEK
jgi:hypothetical protein